MKTWEGKQVLREASARLIPPNDSYPDCCCRLLLTQDHLCVLEDTYRGTYITHFCIPLHSIASVAKISVSGYHHSRFRLINTLSALTGALIWRNAKDGHEWNAMKVRHQEPEGNYTDLIFEEFQGSIDRFVRACQSQIKSIG